MKKSDLLKLVENINDDQEIDKKIEDSELGKLLKSKGATLDSFKEKIKSDKDFKSFLESENDKYHNKAFNTWKENNLEKELEPFISKKYPDLITDPVQKRLLELEKELENERKANTRKDLLSQSINYANEKNIDGSFHYLMEYLLKEDLDSTKPNIDLFSDALSKGLEKMVDERVKSSSYVPGGSDPNNSKDDGLGSRLAKQSSSINSNNHNYFGGAK